MKKLLFILGLFATVTAFGASSTTVIATAGNSNLITSFSGSALLTQVSLTSPANNTATITLVDNNTNNMYFTNAAYIGVTSYVTNQITMWTNFFGSTNYITNLALIDITNTVAAAAVVANRPLTVTAATNSTVTIPGSWFFGRGVWCTNQGSGNATVSITYLNQ